MIYRKNLVDIIQSTVQGMTFPMTITATTNNGDGTWTLAVCDLYHAEPGRIVTIGGNDYTIVSIDDSANTMIVSGTVNITATSFNLYTPYFFVETPINIDNTLKAINDADLKTPMVYMLLKFQETINSDEFDEPIIERNCNFTLFFLTQADFNQWKIGDFMTNAVKPMERLQQQFIAAMKKENKTYYTTDSTYNSTTNPRFGVYINNKGDLKSFTADQLSGVQTDFTGIGIYRDDSCPDC